MPAKPPPISLSRPLIRAVSFAALILVWQLVAAINGDARLLPGPVPVLNALLSDATLPHHLLVTLGRVGASFVLAMAIGSALGLVMGRSKLVDSLFDSWLVLFLNLPALVVIVLAYVWFGLTEAAAIGAVAVNKIPSVIVTIRQGVWSMDRSLLEMADVYRLSPVRTLRHVILPQLAPYFMVSTRAGLSLIWKIVLVVEMIGRSDGVGFQIHTYFQLFDVARILAYSLAFITVVQAFELLVLAPIDRYLTRWRR